MTRRQYLRIVALTYGRIQIKNQIVQLLEPLESQIHGTANSNVNVRQSGGIVSPNTITQGTVPASPPPCTPTMHTTALTFSLSATNPMPGEQVTVTGALVDTCTGLGLAFGHIIFTGTGLPGPTIAVTAKDGTFAFYFYAPLSPGTYTVQGHFPGFQGYYPFSWTIVGDTDLHSAIK